MGRQKRRSRLIAVLLAALSMMALGCGAFRPIKYGQESPTPSRLMVSPRFVELANQLAAKLPLGQPQGAVPVINGMVPDIDRPLAAMTVAWQQYLQQANNALTANTPHFMRTFVASYDGAANTVCAGGKYSQRPTAAFVCPAANPNTEGPTQTHILVLPRQLTGWDLLVWQAAAALAYVEAISGPNSDVTNSGLPFPNTQSFRDCVAGINLRAVAAGVSDGGIQAAVAAAQPLLGHTGPDPQDMAGNPLDNDAFQRGYKTGQISQCSI